MKHSKYFKHRTSFFLFFFTSFIAVIVLLNAGKISAAGCGMFYSYSTPGCVTGDEMSMACSSMSDNGNGSSTCPSGIGGPIDNYICVCTY